MTAGRETRYARRGDAHVAYRVLGHGPVDVLVPSYGFISIGAFDEEPHLAAFLAALGSFARIITFDWLGIGLSDPLPATSPVTPELGVEDALAVLDDIGSERAVFLSWLFTGPTALTLASRHPERVHSLLLVNTTARIVEAPGYDCGLPVSMMRDFDEQVINPEVESDTGVLLRVHAPSVAGDPDFERWWEDAGSRGASPATAHRIQRALFEYDVRDLLASIMAPTLVLQRSDTRWWSAGHGRYLAADIPGARYVELPGADMTPFTENSDLVVEEIEFFLTGERHVHGDATELATVVFTDIVESTRRAAELGDQRWRELIDQHDKLAAREVERFRGRVVKATGDGVLALFASPARAIRCALALRDARCSLGIDLRVGMHVGEVELRGADIAGMTVHIAARIQALADPGEILVSRTVTDLVTGSEIAFTDRGEHELRGVPGRWRLLGVIDT